jgi:hypothetical protein
MVGESSGGGAGWSSATFSDLGSATSDVFAYLGTGAKEQGLQFEEQNYEAAAGLALQNEQFTKTSTAIKQQQSDRESYMSLGKTKAGEAGAGLAQSGSAIDLLRSSAQQGATTTAAIGQQGLITEAGYQEQHDSYMNMAAASDAAQAAEKTSGIGSLIAGGLKLAAGIASIALAPATGGASLAADAAVDAMTPTDI